MPVTSHVNNYKVGSGLVFFDQFAAGTQNLTGEKFFGDCNAVSVTIKSTQLDHYGSTGGVKTPDESATIQADSSGSVTTEDTSVDNLSLFFFGTSSTITDAGTTVASESVGPVIPGLYYQLGISASNPVGVQDLDVTTPPTVKSADGTDTYIAGTDYNIDPVLARLEIISGGAIQSGTTPTVSYKTKAHTKSRVISGTTPIEGALRYISANRTGTDDTWYMPWVKLTPNGSHELIGDKFATLQFDLKVLRQAGRQFLYIDGRAVSS